MNIKETKKSIIQAGHRAVEELIKVAKEAIVDSGDDITADSLKTPLQRRSSLYLMHLKYLTGYKKKKRYLMEKNLRRKKNVYLKDLLKEDLNELRANVIQSN